MVLDKTPKKDDDANEDETNESPAAEKKQSGRSSQKSPASSKRRSGRGASKSGSDVSSKQAETEEDEDTRGVKRKVEEGEETEKSGSN